MIGKDTMSCRIYHGCILKNADGTNKTIGSTEKRLIPTNKCKWKLPYDIPNGVKTRSRAKNEPAVSYEEVDRYIATKYFIHRWIMGRDD